MTVHMDIFNLIIVFLVGIGASIYGTIIGGSSLIIIPLLILMGLPPHAALCTDRVVITGLLLGRVDDIFCGYLFRFLWSDGRDFSVLYFTDSDIRQVIVKCDNS